MVIDSDSSQENDENPYGNGQKDYKKEITGQLGSYFQSSMKSKGKNQINPSFNRQNRKELTYETEPRNNMYKY